MRIPKFIFSPTHYRFSAAVTTLSVAAGFQFLTVLLLYASFPFKTEAARAQSQGNQLAISTNSIILCSIIKAKGREVSLSGTLTWRTVANNGLWSLVVPWRIQDSLQGSLLIAEFSKLTTWKCRRMLQPMFCAKAHWTWSKGSCSIMNGSLSCDIM